MHSSLSSMDREMFVPYSMMVNATCSGEFISPARLMFRNSFIGYADAREGTSFTLCGEGAQDSMVVLVILVD